MIQEVLLSRLGLEFTVVRTNHQLKIMCSEIFSASVHTSILFYISHSLNFRLYQFGLLYRNCKFTRMIISFRHTYKAHLRNQGNQRLGYKHPGAQCGCFVQADLYGNHLRRTICVSKEAMERLPLSNPEGSLMACPQPY
ncbi:Hypothetical_protein [Hexamita inflata]|uniref:Hypothetical_protein n=1 Tax=Hexamita inflata TaxID=28002 RepID=A0AA86QJ74_9EUKA|nr:Hypothetical protein HINF_LOCUS44801 [Hexamita inflata]